MMYVPYSDIKLKSGTMPDAYKLQFDEKEWVTEEEASFEFPTKHDASNQFFALLFVALGLISWLFLASIAYIFNGRSPVAVLKGWFSRN